MVLAMTEANLTGRADGLAQGLPDVPNALAAFSGSSRLIGLKGESNSLKRKEE
jgi:hypothetical protein